MIPHTSRPTVAYLIVAVTACLGGLQLASAADTQQRQPPRQIGVMLLARSPESKDAQEFRKGLQDLGYVEGRDVAIEWRYAPGDYSRAPELAADLVRKKVEVIVVDSTVATRAAKRATSTIPIIMALVADPVGSGLVTNLAHPGGNVTGNSIMTRELSAKRLQLLKEALPRVVRIAVLWNPDTPYSPSIIEELKAEAPLLSLELTFIGARTPEEFGPAFLAITRARAQGLYVVDDVLFFTHRRALLKLATRGRLPTMCGAKQYTGSGALMSYGPNYGDLFRRSAGYVDKILKGAKPGDLPIEQPTKFDFVVNLQTAKALGLPIPQSILQRADEVLQ